jgi:hypothetical protein
MSVPNAHYIQQFSRRSANPALLLCVLRILTKIDLFSQNIVKCEKRSVSGAELALRRSTRQVQYDAWKGPTKVRTAVVF